MHEGSCVPSKAAFPPLFLVSCKSFTHQTVRHLQPHTTESKESRRDEGKV